MRFKTVLRISVILSCQTLIEAAIDQQLNSTSKAPEATEQVVCRDNENRAVDWFILYKEPYPNGNDYLIITSLDTSANWKSFPHGFTHLVGAPELVNTFRPLSDSKVTYAMYSDQPPTRTGSVSEHWGHTKGVVAKFGNQGFFVTHTLPHFPLPLHTKHHRGWSDLKGQIFMCVTFAANHVQWTNVLTHFSNLVPYKYEHSADWKQPEPRFLSHIDLFSLAGTKFRLFSKYGRTGVDIYENILANYFKTKLDVATWRNGAGDKIPSECSGKKTIEDVTNIAFTATTSKGERRTGTWKVTKDHSKWAVSRDGESVFCVGDLNRMESQKRRHGGAFCFENKNVVATFRKMVLSTECGRRNGIDNFF